MISLFSFSFWNKKMVSLRELILHRISKFNTAFRKFNISHRLKRQAKKGILPIEFKSHHGIGVKIIWCLEVLLYCKKNNLEPHFKFSYADSKTGVDFFSAFFQTNTNKEIDKTFVQVRHIGELGLDKNYNKELSIDMSHKLITKHIIPRAEIIAEAETFFQNSLKKEKTLGVHYRSTDKISEAPVVSFENTLMNIDYCLKLNPDLKMIFITSDDHHFIEFMQNSHLSSLVAFRKDSFRSTDNTGIHNRTDVNKYEINKDAIINMLILTKCSFILKSASFLSSCALLFNPSIRYTMLNEPFDKKLWFPESELVKHTAFAPLK